MRTIIFDLDGTLCDITHRLHYIKGEKKDYDAFHKACIYDEPKKDVIDLFHLLNDGANYMRIVSGRSDGVRDETEEWLKSYDIGYDELIMRPYGDYTPDDKLKRNWLREGRLGSPERILCVFDDRQRVVDMWREEGLTCLQVAQWKE